MLVLEIATGTFLGVSISTVLANYLFRWQARKRAKLEAERIDQLRWTLEKFTGEGQAGSGEPNEG